MPTDFTPAFRGALEVTYRAMNRARSAVSSCGDFSRTVSGGFCTTGAGLETWGVDSWRGGSVYRGLSWDWNRRAVWLAWMRMARNARLPTNVHVCHFSIFFTGL
jgi:hypothetical protein